MNIKCFFGFHKWVTTHQSILTSTRYGLKQDTLARVYKCSCCSKQKGTLYFARYTEKASHIFLLESGLMKRVSTEVKKETKIKETSPIAYLSKTLFRQE